VIAAKTTSAKMMFLELVRNVAPSDDITLDAVADADADADADSTIIYDISCILNILYYNVMINNRVLNENDENDMKRKSYIL
jgi:hypothetical protein